MKGQKNVAVERFETLASTQEYAKEKCAEGRELLVVARVQTGGKGTKGRSFSSAVGGLYLSLLSFPKKLPAKEAFKVMQHTAVAVCETLSFFGLQPKIKWPNDIYVGGKKICGILIENALCGALVASSIVGVGLNVNNALPEELTETATSIFKETGKKIPVGIVERELVKRLTGESLAEKYPSYLGWLGERVTLVSGDRHRRVILWGVDETGGLLAEENGEKKRFSSAEISLRIAKE